ncbi:hypothetical protein TWF694_006077 [Orbilia ellipsospora]|uniref:Uncharacterized protein n=1 Tax=Orbilia ellipsospora TaxID=2528407 RepID=A0AAV9WST0_9PEZI
MTKNLEIKFPHANAFGNAETRQNVGASIREALTIEAVANLVIAIVWDTELTKQSDGKFTVENVDIGRKGSDGTTTYQKKRSFTVMTNLPAGMKEGIN